jgi:hypothetical protein
MSIFAATDIGIPIVNKLSGNVAMVAAVVAGVVLMYMALKVLSGIVKIIILVLSIILLSGSYPLKNVITRASNSEAYRQIDNLKQSCTTPPGIDVLRCVKK